MQRAIKGIRCPVIFFFVLHLEVLLRVFSLLGVHQLATKCLMLSSNGPHASSDPLSPERRKKKNKGEKKRKIIQTVSMCSQAAANE